MQVGKGVKWLDLSTYRKLTNLDEAAKMGIYTYCVYIYFCLTLHVMIKPFKTNFMKYHPPNANCLNACSTPLAAGAFPAGTIAYTPTAVLPAGAIGFLVIY